VKAALLGLLQGQGPAVPAAAILLVGAAVFVLANRLARDANTVATATGLGGLWIGSVLLAASTSLPEVFTNLHAAALDAPDVGVADLFGAALANMLILAVLDLVFARRRVLHSVAIQHALTGSLAILLAVLVGMAVLTGGWGRVGHLGLDTLLIAGVYLVGIGFVHQSAPGITRDLDSGSARPSVARSAMGFTIAALALTAVTPLLVVSAKALALETGVSEGAIGTLLVGLTTSLPELAATAAAVRRGALDLAVGNAFGSAAFNMAILVVLDAAYLPGPVLAAVGPTHLLAVLLAVACLALGMMAILSQGRRRPRPAMIESALIVAVYAVGAWALYRWNGP
jgi:cation:H+ antiporter